MKAILVNEDKSLTYAFNRENFKYTDKNDSISINKSTEDVNTYIISIVTEGNVIEFCCKYENSTLTVLNDNSYLGVNITAIASEDGTYAIITKYETLG